MIFENMFLEAPAPVNIPQSYENNSVKNCDGINRRILNVMVVMSNDVVEIYEKDIRPCLDYYEIALAKFDISKERSETEQLKFMKGSWIKLDKVLRLDENSLENSKKTRSFGSLRTWSFYKKLLTYEIYISRIEKLHTNMCNEPNSCKSSRNFKVLKLRWYTLLYFGQSIIEKPQALLKIEHFQDVLALKNRLTDTLEFKIFVTIWNLPKNFFTGKKYNERILRNNKQIYRFLQQFIMGEGSDKYKGHIEQIISGKWQKLFPFSYDSAFLHRIDSEVKIYNDMEGQKTNHIFSLFIKTLIHKMLSGLYTEYCYKFIAENDPEFWETQSNSHFLQIFARYRCEYEKNFGFFSKNPFYVL